MKFDIKDIKGYEGLYAVTTKGRVWSYRKKKFLKQYLNNDGYYQLALYKDGRSETKRINRLVAEAFIPNTKGNCAEVNHIDEVKTNNRVENLEWVTHKENVNHGSRTAKTYKAVYCVELDKTFESMTAAARELGLEVSSISACCRGKLKTTGKKHFRYA